MRALRLVGPGEDGTSLIVEAVEVGSLEGERFTLSLDERLRSMATAHPDQQSETPGEPPAESSGPVPTPREIQVRVRAGETAQAVADEAGIPLERVMRFAFPVLQERVRVTDEARRARARRGGDGLLVPFGELVDSRLTRHGVDPAAVRWDAYRREDGGWTVTAEFSAHERTLLAKFSFALLNRTVSALDDIAADLLSDRPVRALLPPPPPAVEPIAEAADPVPASMPDPVAASMPDWDAPPPPPRLTAVPNPSRTDVPRPQEASPAVRPPSRRQKAHTRAVPVATDDELFDQNAFDQDVYGQGAAARDASTRDGADEQPWHEPQLPFEIGASSEPLPGRAARHRAQRPAATDAPSHLNVAGTGSEEPDVVRSIESAGSPSADRTPADDGDADSPVRAEPTPEAGVAAGRPSALGEAQSRRGRRSGDKPRMPSWDDILLGVRHKSD